jgi:Cu/Ag efflux protein CusF
MFNISLFLEKFKNLGLNEKLLKEAISCSVKEIIGFDLDPKKISLKNGEVIFKVSPAIKNTIYIKKEAILAKIKENNIENIGNIR